MAGLLVESRVTSAGCKMPQKNLQLMSFPLLPFQNTVGIIGNFVQSTFDIQHRTPLVEINFPMRRNAFQLLMMQP